MKKKGSLVTHLQLELPHAHSKAGSRNVVGGGMEKTQPCVRQNLDKRGGRVLSSLIHWLWNKPTILPPQIHIPSLHSE